MDSLPTIHHSHISISLTHSSPQPTRKFFHPSSFPPRPPFSRIRAKHNSFHKPQTPLNHLLKTLNPLLSPLIKPSCVALVATAFFFMRHRPFPLASADPLPPPLQSSASEIPPDERAASETLPDESTASEILPDESTASEILPDESTASETLPDESTASETLPDESTASEILPDESTASETLPDESTASKTLPDESTTSETLPDEGAPSETLSDASAPSETLSDASAVEEQPREEVAELESLLKTKIRAREIDDAILVLDRLIELEPEELEYPFLKANLHMRNGEHELAAEGLEDLIKRDPFHVETYRCLLMLISETKAPTMKLLKKIEETVKVCEEQERDSDVRDFKLLIAQIKVIDGALSDALKVYEELEKEEPKDFRPYLCQGIVYTMLKKSDEAAKQFEKYRMLVPENHPSKQYFEDNTKILETGQLGAKN